MCVCMCAGVNRERERRDGNRTDRETGEDGRADRHTYVKTDRQTEAETETEKERERESVCVCVCVFLCVCVFANDKTRLKYHEESFVCVLSLRLGM